MNITGGVAILANMSATDSWYVPSNGCFSVGDLYGKDPTPNNVNKRHWAETWLNFNAGHGNKVRPFSRSVLLIIRY